jgi:hypothetical protein
VSLIAGRTVSGISSGFQQPDGAIGMVNFVSERMESRDVDD